ncbi:unnamed protein product, partial [Meganyctiphanes norvegica]
MANRYFEGVNHAEIYAKFRPVPPQTLIATIIAYLKQKYLGPLDTVLDIGCGSGQSTQVLASHFNSVIGLDISEAQIKMAIKAETNENIQYKVSASEKLK